MTRTLAILLILACAQPLVAQQQTGGESERAFDRAAETVQRQLQEALVELAALREEIAAETIPLSRRLNELESELIDVRQQYQQTSRTLDARTLDLGNLRTEIKSRREEVSYLSNLLGEYTRNFESRLHIAEIQRYREPLQNALLAMENTALTADEVYRAQAALLEVSLDRLDDALGGARFDGTAVDAGGLVNHGTFVLVGPAAFFRDREGRIVGSVEQRLGSLEPAVFAFDLLEDADAASALIAGAPSNGGPAALPLDPSLGNALKVASTNETLVEHVQKGGPVMIPIFALAGAALLVALFKWLTLTLVRRPSRRKVRALLQAVARDDRSAAQQIAGGMRGPGGRMLATGVEHLGEPRELVEEVMYETVLATRLRLNRMLPFIAICAASAPLLGLLGTVTGIMNTFRLITVFGTGDVKTLSSGISEALITTEFGLIVAIPSLLLHALLSRKAKRTVDDMERTALAFANCAARQAPREQEAVRPRAPASGDANELRGANAAIDAAMAPERLRELLVSVLGTMTEGAAMSHLKPPPVPSTTPHPRGPADAPVSPSHHVAEGRPRPARRETVAATAASSADEDE